MTQQERIKELSGYLGMSLNAIAKEAGLSPQKFYDIMSGRRWISSTGTETGTKIFLQGVALRYPKIDKRL